MILYFSGTGNSEYVAKKIGDETGDTVLNLFEKIRESDFEEIHSGRAWVMVVPTYAWRMPHLVEDWFRKTKLSGNKNIYFVMTCGANIGNAGGYLKELCVKKHMKYMGCMEVVMPENYIAMFQTPTQEEALKIIDKAEESIEDAAYLIKNKNAFPRPELSWTDKINSGIVNGLFYPMFVHAKSFYTTDACVACGKCVDVCPLQNIELNGEWPTWGNNCTHCMACICKCPSEAIEYGKHSVGLPRYTCPK